MEPASAALSSPSPRSPGGSTNRRSCMAVANPTLRRAPRTLNMPASSTATVWRKRKAVGLATEPLRVKKKRIKQRIYKNRELAVNDIADYIETFYNRTRRHGHLGGVSPEQFEVAHKPRRKSVH